MFFIFFKPNYQMHFGDAFMPWWLIQLFHLIKTQPMWNHRDRSGDAQPATKTQHGRSWGEDAAGLLDRVDFKKGLRNTRVKVDSVWLPRFRCFSKVCTHNLVLGVTVYDMYFDAGVTCVKYMYDCKQVSCVTRLGGEDSCRNWTNL